jgi:peptidoglycan-associated lipoprotein
MRNYLQMKAVFRFIAPLAAVCLILTGCPDKKPKYPTCKSDKDCRLGERCVNQKCVQCADDGDCGPGETCQANACVRRDGWCATDADCPDHKICRDNECIACTSDDECEGGTCVDGACLKPGECVKDEHCQDDEDCVDGRCKRAGLGGAQPKLDCELETVYFAFDSATIREEFRVVLERNAKCVNSHNGELYVIGHTDPRGTDEYNVALSDGRARTVADFLANLGVDPGRFHVVPRGEADAQGTDEQTWTKDRRVSFEWK